MNPVDQTQFYDKEKGTHGNCQQAALASLLGLPLDEVPNFMAIQLDKDDPRGFWEAFFEFVRSRGFEPYEFHSNDPKEVPTFAGYYLAYGTSPRGVSHAVVYRDGKLAHDPHPSRAGILKVETMTMLIPLDPANMVLRA